MVIELNTAYISYIDRRRCRIKCLKIGMNPNMHSEMNSSVKTFELLFRRLESRMEPKKMALMLVGVPVNSLCGVFSLMPTGCFGFKICGGGPPCTL